MFKRYRRDLVDALAVESTENKLSHVEKLINPKSDPTNPGNGVDLLVMSGQFDLISNYLGAR
jgi:hypothetical protein